jgi:hypothetical protein
LIANEIGVLTGAGSATPEPGTMALLGLGVTGLFVARRRFASR